MAEVHRRPTASASRMSGMGTLDGSSSASERRTGVHRRSGSASSSTSSSSSRPGPGTATTPTCSTSPGGRPTKLRRSSSSPASNSSGAAVSAGGKAAEDAMGDSIARHCHRAGFHRSWLGVVGPRPSSHLDGASFIADKRPLGKDGVVIAPMRTHRPARRGPGRDPSSRSPSPPAPTRRRRAPAPPPGRPGGRATRSTRPAPARRRRRRRLTGSELSHAAHDTAGMRRMTPRGCWISTTSGSTTWVARWPQRCSRPARKPRRRLASRSGDGAPSMTPP